MAFSFSRHKHEEVAIVFDIASGSVGASLMCTSRHDRPIVLYTYRAPIAFKDYKNFDDFYHAMKSALVGVVDMLSKEGVPHLNFIPLRNKHIKHVLVLFASPWFMSQTRRIHFEQTDSFELTPEMLQKITQKEIDDFLSEEHKKKILNTSDSLSVIDHATVQVKLNGYEVSDPYNKKSKVLDTAIFLSVVSKQIREEVTSIIESAFGVRDIVFHTFPLASFSVLRDNFVAENNFAMIDMSGEVTDVSVIRDGVLKEVFSAPVGKNVLIREVSKQFTTVAEEAVSMLSMYANDSLDSKSRIKVERVLTQAVEKLKEFFESVITSVESSGTMPKQIFILADKQTHEWFSRFSSLGNTTRYEFNGEKYTIVLVREQTLSPFVRYNQGVTRDVFLTVGGLFLDTVVNMQPNPQKPME